MRLKTCTKCNVPKPATEDFFNKRPESKDGLRSQCKTCRGKVMRAYTTKVSISPKYDEGLFKICSKCKISKEVNKLNFDACVIGVFGVHSWCRDCCRINNQRLDQRNRLNETPVRNFVNIKKCSQCKEIFPTAAFGYNKTMHDGFYAICTFCVRNRNNSRRKCGDSIDVNAFNEKIILYNNKCAYCKMNPFEHIDHFYPLNPKEGNVAGTHNIENLFPACAECNMSKSNKDPDEWLIEKSYVIIVYSLWKILL